MLIVEPAFIAFFVVIVEEVGLQQFVHQGRHVLEDLLADRRSQDAQRKWSAVCSLAISSAVPGA